MDEATAVAVMTGRCLCGAVSFAATDVDTNYHACHCRMCQRWSGGPVLAADSHGVTFEGEANIARYASSDWAERGFCKTCGSHLFYFLKPTSQYMLCVGAFDNSLPFSLVRELYIDHKAPGYAFAGPIEQLSEQQVIEMFTGSGGGNGET